MKVEKDRVVTISYTLSTAGGQVIESSDARGAPLRFVFGFSPLLPGLDKRLEGLARGEEKEFDLGPDEAFGTDDSGPEAELARTEFPAGAALAPGAKFEAKLPDGGGPVRILVTAVQEGVVKVRYQHPLAGQRIKAKVRILEVRNATNTEMVTGEVEVPPPIPGGR